MTLFGETDQQREVAEAVDLPGDAVGQGVQRGQGLGLKDRADRTGYLKAVVDVGGRFLEVEVLAVAAGSDTLMEGLAESKAKLVGQVRLAKEDKGE